MITITKKNSYNSILYVCLCALNKYSPTRIVKLYQYSQDVNEVDKYDVYDDVNYNIDCLICVIRAPCPSSDQRRKVTKVLRRAGAPHTRRTMSLYALYSKSLQILYYTTAILQHQLKIFQHPILHHRPIQIPIQYGYLIK